MVAFFCVSAKFESKTILSTLYNHAIRYEWLTFNPIGRVRTSSKRLRDKDVLPPKSSSVLRNSYLCATGQWSCWLVALVYGDRKLSL